VLGKELKNVFGINKYRLFFMNNDDTFSFYKDNKESKHDYRQGFVGTVFDLGSKNILLNNRNSIYYNANIDITS